MATARIIIERNSGNDIKMRDLLVSIDGEEVANLHYGQSFETDLTPGPHLLTVSNRLFHEDASFEAAHGGHAHFMASNEISGVGLVMLELLGVGPYRTHLSQLAD